MATKLSPLATPSVIIEGFKLLWHRRIRWLVIIPIIINIVMFSAATWLAGLWLSDWLNGLMASVPEWLEWLVWVIWLLFALLTLVVYAFTFTLLANLVGSPFYGIIAERIISLERGDSEQSPQTLATLLNIAKDSFLRELQILAYLLPRTIAILLLTLIISFMPVINIFAPIIAGTWAAWALSVQYFDYPADIDQVGFREVRQRAGAQRWLSLSFGLSALGAAAIPIFNLLLLPATVIGGTLLWCREYSDQEYGNGAS
jgi:CysZ protein